MSVDIDAPPEKVWPYLVEPEKTIKWYAMLKKFDYTDGRSGGMDSTFYWEEEVRGRIYATHFTTKMSRSPLLKASRTLKP